MLTDELRAEGWIEHDGGPCPVPLDSMPGVLWGDGHLTPIGEFRAGEWCDQHDSWMHFGPRKHHIIAYKPETTDAR